MSRTPRIALVGDFNPSITAHRAIPVALEMAATHWGIAIAPEWVATGEIRDAARDLAGFDGVWCVPGSPYANMQGALDAIRFARERHIPLLGTCAGFQHALIEYARNVLGIADTDHAETNAESVRPLISLLSCSMVEAQEEIFLEPGSLFAKSYGAPRIVEGYRCNYGPDPAREAELFSGELRVAARGTNGDVRGGQLGGHRFFVGALFQPERRALKGELPPLVRDFVAAARGDS